MLCFQFKNEVNSIKFMGSNIQTIINKSIDYNLTNSYKLLSQVIVGEQIRLKGIIAMILNAKYILDVGDIFAN